MKIVKLATSAVMASLISVAALAQANDSLTHGSVQGTSEPGNQTGSENASAPFGVPVGQSVNKLQIVKEIKKHIYVISPPNPNAQFVLYMAVATKEQGVCKIVAVTEKNNDDQGGDGVRGIINSISAALENKYGKSKLYSFVSPKSVLADNDRWAWSIANGDRTYARIWTKEVGSSMPIDISSIFIQAQAEPTRTTTANLTYEFANFEACQSVLKKVDASNL